MAQTMVSIPALCKLAAVNLWVNKVRSLLTISGMVFGTAAVIATLSSSEGAQRFVKKQLESLGANIITVYSEKGEPFAEQDIALIGKNSGVFDSIAIAAGIPATYEKSEFAPLGVNLPVVGYQTSGFKAATLEIDY
ncbi:MAG: ABC transporter permease [Proteobacteria bacterium]|nr:ABC transporter permease [Pseudomonadota bacterium]